MNTYNKFLVLGLLVLFAGCASQIDLPKGVNYDYNMIKYTMRECEEFLGKSKGGVK